MLVITEGGIPLKLQIKRMRCGDCAVLEGRRARLIVDCGSDNQAADGSLTARDFAYAAIAAQINDLMPTHILISHLHTDHYRGFLNLGKDAPPMFCTAPPVDTAYLPWTILGGRAVLAAAYARLYLTAPPRTLAHELARGLMDLLPILEREAAHRQMLQAGDVIPLEGKKLEVLWPQVEPALKSLPVCGGKSFAEADRAMEAAFLALADQGGNGRLLEDGPRLTGALERYLLLLHDGPLAEAGRLDALDTLEAALRQADRLRLDLWGDETDGLRPPYPEDLQPLADFARQQYHVLVNGVNACGIIFQWKDKVLFPGDAPPAVISFLKEKGRFQPRYQLVKLPHHGTRRYFSPALPPAERYIISNGGYSRRAVGKEVLEDLAPAGCTFLCTDAHRGPRKYCKYFREEGHCHPACVPITDRQQVIPL